MLTHCELQHGAVFHKSIKSHSSTISAKLFPHSGANRYLAHAALTKKTTTQKNDGKGKKRVEGGGREVVAHTAGATGFVSFIDLFTPAGKTADWIFLQNVNTIELH